MSTTTLTAGTKVTIVKGCKARDLSKGTKAVVTAITPMGAEYSHMVQIVLAMNGRTIALWARHLNRLSEATIAMNDGNPSHRIEIKRA